MLKYFSVQDIPQNNDHLREFEIGILSGNRQCFRSDFLDYNNLVKRKALNKIIYEYRVQSKVVRRPFSLQPLVVDLYF